MVLPTQTNGDAVRKDAHPLERFFDGDWRRFDPFSELANMRRTMNSLLDSAMRPSEGQSQFPGWAPPIDLYEKDGLYHVDVALPGLKKDDIDIEVTDNRLTISGNFEQTSKSDDSAKYLYREVRRGGFTRTIAFNDDIDAEKVAASYENGILKLSVPLVKTLQAKKVAIKG